MVAIKVLAVVDSQGKGSISSLTPSLHGQIKFNKNTSMYCEAWISYHETIKTR